MILKFARFDLQIELTNEAVSTLEICDRSLFSRIVQSLLSDKGERAIEPYFFFDEGKAIAPKGRALIIHSLPQLPVHDRSFEKALFDRLNNELHNNANADDSREKIEKLFLELNEVVKGLSLELWGSYEFSVNWNLPTYLKAFGYGLEADSDSSSLLDRCIQFFGLCVDIGFQKPLIFVNAKSFFSSLEVETLFEQAFFHGLSVLFLEPWPSDNRLSHEVKYKIDLGFSNL